MCQVTFLELCQTNEYWPLSKPNKCFKQNGEINAWRITSSETCLLFKWAIVINVEKELFFIMFIPKRTYSWRSLIGIEENATRKSLSQYWKSEIYFSTIQSFDHGCQEFLTDNKSNNTDLWSNQLLKIP